MKVFREETARLAGLDLPEVAARIRENPTSVAIEWDPERGYRLFDPFGLVRSEKGYRGEDGWTEWAY
jgi:hypothetical protein